jgi:hypothetical protein
MLACWTRASAEVHQAGCTDRPVRAPMVSSRAATMRSACGKRSPAAARLWAKSRRLQFIAGLAARFASDMHSPFAQRRNAIVISAQSPLWQVHIETTDAICEPAEQPCIWSGAAPAPRLSGCGAENQVSSKCTLPHCLEGDAGMCLLFLRCPRIQYGDAASVKIRHVAGRNRGTARRGDRRNLCVRLGNGAASKAPNCCNWCVGGCGCTVERQNATGEILRQHCLRASQEPPLMVAGW